MKYRVLNKCNQFGSLHFIKIYIVIVAMEDDTAAIAEDNGALVHGAAPFPISVS